MSREGQKIVYRARRGTDGRPHLYAVVGEARFKLVLSGLVDALFPPTPHELEHPRLHRLEWRGGGERGRLRIAAAILEDWLGTSKPEEVEPHCQAIAYLLEGAPARGFNLAGATIAEHLANEGRKEKDRGYCNVR